MFVYTLSAMILITSSAPAPQLDPITAGIGALAGVDLAIAGVGVIGGALFTPATGLVIGGAGAASIPTSVLLLKKAALVKGAIIAGLLASRDN